MESFNVLKQLFRDWKGSYRWLTLSMILIIFSVSGTLLIPYLSSFLINNGITTGNSDVITRYGIYMLIVAIFVGFCDFLNMAISISFSERSCHAFRYGVFGHIQSFSFGALDTFNSSDLLIRLTTDIQNIKIGIFYGINNLFRVPLLLLVSLFFLWITSPQLMWVAVVLLVLESLLLALYLWLSSKAYDTKQIQYDKLNNILRESLAGIRVVKAFVRQDLENERFKDASEELYEAALKPQYYFAFLTPTLMMLTYLGTAGILYIGGLGLIQGTGLTLGGITASLTYVVMVLMPIIILGNSIPFITSGITSLRRVYQIINSEPDIKSTDHAKPVDAHNLKGGIKFDHVSFAYPVQDGKKSTMALKDITLEIKPGEVVGFLGATGSGKSTLINLIPRFYDITSGEITIDGIDIREIPLETLRYQIAAVALQESNFFSGTIRENIIVGATDKSYDAMVQAAKAADAHDFVNAMPQKYDTVIARKGADLSGGQRQRLSIARTLMMNPKILILDDSTSACDVATEARIQDSIHDLMKDVTQLIVAQRISTVITADKIVLMDKGRIIAIGSHEELLESNELYKEIYASQLGVGAQVQGVVK